MAVLTQERTTGVMAKNMVRGSIISGRSDATMNPGGVRIGTADIYSEIEQFDGVEDGVVAGQKSKNDVRVILFVKMVEGVALTAPFEQMYPPGMYRLRSCQYRIKGAGGRLTTSIRLH